MSACLIACVAANDCAILQQLASCVAAADVAQVRAPSRPSPLLMQLYRHAVSSRIGLGKLSTLPSVSDLGREEGDCGGEKTDENPRIARTYAAGLSNDKVQIGYVTSHWLKKEPYYDCCAHTITLSVYF